VKTNLTKSRSSDTATQAVAQLPEKLIIMYHSVSSETQPEVLGSFSIPLARFQYQIRSALDLGYQSKPISFLSKTPKNGEKWLFITGDDGTVDWTRNVLPWCETQRLYTHTGVITGPWHQTPIYPLAHVVQVILANRDETALSQLASRLLDGLTQDKIDYIQRIYAYESSDTRRVIKGACNLMLDANQAFELIGEMTVQEKLLLEQRFESPDYYKQFQYAEVGVHTTSHQAMGLDIDGYLSDEIDLSEQEIRRAGLKRSGYFTLPMKPKYGATVESIEAPLSKRGYQGLLYSENAVWDGKGYVIPRIDAKNVEKTLGIAALVEPVDGGQPSIIHYFLTQAQQHSTRTAIHCRQQAKAGDEAYQSLSYHRVAELTAKLSHQLKQAGLQSGEHCVVVLNNSVEFALLFLAAAELNLVIAPVASSLAPVAIQTAIDSTDSHYLIAVPHVLNKYLVSDECKLSSDKCFAFSAEGCTSNFENDLSRIFDPNYQCDYVLGQTIGSYDSDFILTMTSGSTGQPKPIVLTQKTKVHRSLDGAKDLYQLNGQEVIIAASPMYHSLAQRLVLLPLMTGGTSVILPNFTPEIWLKAVEIHRVTFTLAVSSHLEQLLLVLRSENAPEFDLSSLRCLVSSSSLLQPEIKARCIETFGCDFHECYGASEVGIVSNLTPEDIEAHPDLINTVGKALPYVRLKIVDDNKKEVAMGVVGEIACETTTAFSRYYKRRGATAESVVDGFFHSGDLGRLDERGFLYLHGRKKELIIVGGTNVYPKDIESVISKVNGIKEVAVIGVEDAYFGEAILAVLVLDGEARQLVREARKACMANLADFQQPMAYEVVDALPRNTMGKLMKHQLQLQFEGYDATKSLRRMLAVEK
jgi:long-chain acyl-CoA synthetase